MKIQVTLKDPDVLYDAIEESLDDNKPDNLDDEEWSLVKEKRQGELSNFASKWFEYGEYLTVELDTEANTCVVREVNE